MKLIRHNLGVNTCCEVTEGLFKQFLDQDDKYRSNLPPIPSFLPAPEEGDTATTTAETTTPVPAAASPFLTAPPPPTTTQRSFDNNNGVGVVVGSWNNISLRDDRSIRLMDASTIAAAASGASTPRFQRAGLPTLSELSTPRSGDGEEKADEEESLLKERVTTPV